MTRFRLLLSFACIILMVLPIRAEKVDVDKAAKLAQHYVQSKRLLQTGSVVRLKYAATKSYKMKRSAQPAGETQPDAQDTAYYYVFSVNENTDEGFVIISGDDAVKPILGWSDHGSYDENDLPPNFVYWMDCLQQEIHYARSHKLPQSETVRKAWSKYLNEQPGDHTIIVDQLIRTTWYQDAPYWNLCPMVDELYTYTGCMATAMAQIMNYHRYPARGIGKSEAYTTRTTGMNVPAVDFEVDYDWANMLDSYSEGATIQQQDAVATLMYHCGVSVRMDYTTDGSGAYTFRVPSAMANHFGYDNNISLKRRPSYDNISWESMIKEQLDAGLPVLYCGVDSDEGGHAFICDGYDNNGNFHFNWGWGGKADAWFVTTALDTKNGSFNSGQEIVVNIKPSNRNLGKNASLSSLNIAPGKLVPEFNPDAIGYIVSVDNSITSILITGEADDDGANISGLGFHALEQGNNIVNIVVTAPDGITSQTYTVVVTRNEIISGVENSDSQQPLVVYPNPTDGRFTVNFTQFDTYRVLIHSLSGKLLSKEMITGQSSQMDISSYPQGIYLLTVEDGKRKTTVKIVKDR